MARNNNRNSNQRYENPTVIDKSEKYQRPSKSLPLKNPFNYQLFLNNESNYIFNNPTDVIYAYYGILKEASNMEGYLGGCGTIGDGLSPYEYAYKLLSKEIKSYITLEELIQTFAGVGHLTLLKLFPLPQSDSTENTQHFIIEVEWITGHKINGEEDRKKESVTYFAYYYGIVTVVKEGEGWYIQKIKYIPEDFLCAPYHSWYYDSDAILKIVYTEDLKIIKTIANITFKDGLLSFYCSDGQNEYRIDFVRLTNGHDILINESILLNGRYIETSIIGKGWEYLKLSPKNLK